MHSTTIRRWATGAGEVLWETSPDHNLNIIPERHWFRLMSDPHEQFCWTTRLCRVMLLRRGTSLSLGGDYDIDPHAMSLL
jgi:hypothetical protein